MKLSHIPSVNLLVSSSNKKYKRQVKIEMSEKAKNEQERTRNMSIRTVDQNTK